MPFCSIALQILAVASTHVKMHISEAKKKGDPVVNAYGFWTPLGIGSSVRQYADGI